MEAPISMDDSLVVKFSNGMGINRTISISNTMKIIANKKNRMEKGIRALWLGSNPHSKGDSFSRDAYVDRDERTHAARYTIMGSAIAVMEEIKRFII